tara:strand:- start:6387 stop:6959 length:573 start_codon:yes stop_codon:yes gene_type:complete
MHKCIGYARAIKGDIKYLDEQIESLKNFGCNYIFSEIISLNQNPKPQLDKALNKLSKGDQLVFTKLDRAFQSQYECITTINKLLNKGIHLYTVSGFLCSKSVTEIYPAIFNVLYELEILKQDISLEKKKELSAIAQLTGRNVGGRPKINSLKEELVVHLRKEGFSYRSIRSQTGIALSTIRRILLDYSAS